MNPVINEGEMEVMPHRMDAVHGLFARHELLTRMYGRLDTTAISSWHVSMRTAALFLATCHYGTHPSAPISQNFLCPLLPGKT